MPLPVQSQVKYWGIATAVLVLLLWSLGNVLLPFVMGSAIAYFLDPVADRLERMGLGRGLATALITVGGALVFVVMALAVIPSLIGQALALVDTAPQLARDLLAFLTDRFPALMDEGSVVRQTLNRIAETLQARGGSLLNSALSSAVSFLNLLVVMLITPVVAVYMLLDWDRMVARVDDLLPLDHRDTIRMVARDVDAVLAGFVRGMGSVCMILGTYYAIGLWAVGLQFGLVVGVVAGALTFIPYVGALVGGVLAIGLALFQFWGEWPMIIAVWFIFQSGQFIEGNILTPRLVGSSVGLHPVWLLLALSVFGSLFGFVGMLVAVPVAAALGVIARFATGQYKISRLYRGIVGRDQE
ncbi:MAG: AI-2E family transporter [Pelagimonas sp.]|jgi:predicted PurR-regulated permease PerM|nr:AI-2E family transporter [Pelagimonas sp.]